MYSVEIPSPDSGVSCDPDLTSPKRNTPLHMAFWSGCDPQGVQRALAMDDTAATTYANLVPGAKAANRQIPAIANSTTYGGVGGTYATASGGNAMSSLITPHELGHSLGGLQDEYDHYARGVRGDAYTGGEPDSVHHTLLTEQQMTQQQQKKWWRWLGEPSLSGGTIGRYESGMYSSTGVWRPSAHSIMKTLGYYYDQVGREDMTKSISAKTSIVQDATPTSKPIGADRVVWVVPMHPNSLLPGPPACTTTITGKHEGALVIGAGVTCLDHAQVSGAIVVQPGASLVATSSTITGGVAATSANAVELLDTTVHGAATIVGAAQDVTIVGGAITGALTLSGNHTGSRQPVVAGIAVSGTLSCAGNAPAPSNIAAPNTVRGGSIGQCSTL